MQYAIIAEFDILPGKAAELEQLLHETAAYALAEEPRCLRFDVLWPVDEHGQVIPDRLMTSELFEGFAGVEAHRASPRTPPRVAHIRALVRNTRIIHAALIPAPARTA